MYRLAPYIFKYGYKYGKKLYKFVSKYKHQKNKVVADNSKRFFKDHRARYNTRAGDLTTGGAAAFGLGATAAVGGGVYAFAKANHLGMSKSKSATSKRVRTSDNFGGMSNADNTVNYHPRGSSIGVGQDANYTKSFSKYGRSSGSLKKYALQKMVRMATQSTVYRFQSLTDMGSFAGEYSQPLKVTVTPLTHIDLPMYAYNLSGNCTLAGGNTAAPFYRARKYTPLGVPLQPTVANYGWTTIAGRQALPDGNDSGSPVLESSTQVPVPSSTYRHDWSNIELLFNCAKHNPCTIHVAVVKWVTDSGPNTEYYTPEGSVPFYDSLDPASQEQTDIDSFWESFWAPRIVHPLSSFPVPDKQRHIKFLKHERINVHAMGGSISDENYDIRNTTHLKKLFVRTGKFFNLANNRNVDATIGNIAAPVSADGAGEFANRPGGFNAFTRQDDPDFYAPRNRDTWLLIWADHYRTGLGGATTAEHFCSFDFKVRSKFTSIV